MTEFWFTLAMVNKYIPDVLHNDNTSLSNIKNVILRGDLSNNSDFAFFSFKNSNGENRYLFPFEYQAMIKEIGMNIYNNNFSGNYKMPEGHTWDEIENYRQQMPNISK